MMEQTGASEEDINGLVNYTRIVRGVEVGALFKQMDDGSTRVALRSNNYVDVARLATRYGGGGHARAAGFSFPGGLDDAERQVTEEAKRAVEQSV
jgi:phosphoesterase RecJ-like protein